jgi:hypothetical protein
MQYTALSPEHDITNMSGLSIYTTECEGLQPVGLIWMTERGTEGGDMLGTETLSEEDVMGFCQQYAGDAAKMQLLAFWGEHPRATFTMGAIAGALGCGRLQASRALAAFVESGLVEMCVENGSTCCRLTMDESRRRPVLGIAAMGWGRWMAATRRDEGGYRAMPLREEAGGLG